MKDSTNTNTTKEDDDNKDAATLSETFGFVYRCGWKARLLFVTGTLGGIAHGLAYPMVAYFLSQTFETMSRISGDARQDQLAGAAGDPMQDIREISFTFMLLGVYSLVAAFLETASLEWMAFQATRLFQLEWFEALLRQDAAFFDIHTSATTAPTSVMKYRQGLGQRFGQLIQALTTCIAGVGLGLYSSWRVSLLVFAILPMIAITTLSSVRMNQGKTQRANEFYQQANSTAFSTLSSLRTVLSLNALPHFIEQYQAATQHALKSATSVLLKLGLMGGATISAVICLFVGVILFGSFVLYRDLRETGCNPAGGPNSCENSGADIFGAMLGILFAGNSLSQFGSCLEALTAARVAAKDALKVISRTEGSPAKTFHHKKEDTRITEFSTRVEVEESGVVDEETPSAAISAVLPKYEINPFSEKGIIRPKIIGKLEFRDVTFAYPSRPSVPILKNFSMTIPAGKTVALVGPSGGGKSTVLSMIERFYDPTEGRVFLDGLDIKDLNLQHYRKGLGYVGQEPSLFATTIRENIAYGAENVTQAQIETAAKMANAHEDFILSLPDGYDTHVGDKGAQLSGGQKQRVAIARVLVRQPKILCLDEATSALDAESELHVQEALDNILEQGSMTAVIVAHRLSTIRNADLIYVIADGGVVESGTHEELMESETGRYRQLVEKQEGKGTATATSSPNLSTQNSLADDQESSEFFPSPLEDVPLTRGPLLEFRDVQFAYPSRPDKPVLKKFTLSVMAGETLALVGPSGGGKSTTVGLIERFYDPSNGEVVFRGQDIKSLHSAWYRDQIGYVGQEPNLFPGTIAENIALGAPDATQEMIEEAAKQANIHDFVMTTPEMYNTQVGEDGKQLSGGQKQRVAIARALIRKPKILLLDEATSALDSDSEAIVQEALDKLMQSHEHTVIVIAHKLSTIRACADRIAVVGNGEVLEIGSHDELADKKRGHYKRLLEAQKRQTSLHTLGLSKPLKTTAEEGSPDEDVEGDDTAKNPEQDKNEEVETESIKTISQRVKQLTKPDLFYMVVGAVGAMLAGATYPLLGLLFAETINVFFYQVRLCSGDQMSAALGFDSCEDYWQDAAEEMQDTSFEVATYYALLIASSLVGFSTLYWGFGKASERLSKRLRDSLFTALVRQEVGFFDMRNVGEINSKLQESTARLHAFSGTPLRQFILAMTSVVVGLIISFIVMWPYALLCIGCMVPVAFAGKQRRKKELGQSVGLQEVDSKASSGAIMVEALLNIKTVAALGLERQQMEAFEAAIGELQQTIKKDSAFTGVMSGLGEFIQRWSNAVLYFWGGWLLLNHPEHFGFQDFLISQFTFIFSTLGLAAALQDMDDKAEVEVCARWIFEVLDRQSAIDPLSQEGKKLDQAEPPSVEKDFDA